MCLYSQTTTEIDSGLKKVKDERKRNYKQTLATLDVRDIVHNWIPDRNEQTEDVMKFVEHANELCWMMNINDPPVNMCFECVPGETFNKNMFVEYTQAGNVNAFLVWPALLLTEEGMLLRKGVAQPTRTQYHVSIIGGSNKGQYGKWFSSNDSYKIEDIEAHEVSKSKDEIGTHENFNNSQSETAGISLRKKKSKLKSSNESKKSNEGKHTEAEMASETSSLNDTLTHM